MNKICHITVLNPSTHNRIFHKLAKSQTSFGYEVFIIGQDSAKAPYELEGVHILPIPEFGRLSIQRLIQYPIRMWRYTRKYPAQIYWLHTPELMWLGAILRLLGKKVVYDVHEDYFQTILYAKHYPSWIRKPIAFCLRRLEKRWASTLDAVVYAESCYDNILELPPARFYLLRNTFSFRSDDLKACELPFQAGSYMLYTGTIAEEWGIFRSLALWQELHSFTVLPFIIAGFTHSPQLVKRIQQWVESAGIEEHFALIGGTSYVPYEEIVYLIKNCRFGTALYEINPAIQGKIPTKFYEYMAFDKALVYTPEPAWVEFDNNNRLGVAWKSNTDRERLWASLQSWKAVHTPAQFSWEQDEKVLEHLLSQISL